MSTHRTRVIRSRRSVAVLVLVGLAAGHASVAVAQDGPTASPGPSPSAPAQHPLHDPFDMPRAEPGPWWIGADEQGSSAYADGGMRWTLEGKGVVWDVIDLGYDAVRLRVTAAVLVEQGSGGGGPTCAAGPDDAPFLWAGINGDGEWLLGRIVDRHLQVAERGELPTIRRHDVPTGAPFALRVTLDCSTDPLGGGDRARVWIEDVLVAEVEDVHVGPYRAAGLTAASDGPGFAILFDDFVADSREDPMDPERSSDPPSGAPSSTAPSVTP